MNSTIPGSHTHRRSFPHSHGLRSPELRFVNPYGHPLVFLACALLICLSLFSCTSVPAPAHDQRLPDEHLLPVSHHSEAEAEAETEESHEDDHHAPLDSLSMDERMLMSTPANPRSTYANPDDPVFSFRAQDMPLTDALALFARTNNLNIVAGPDVKGKITVDFQGLPLD